MTELMLVTRILSAVTNAGSPRYIHHCGATLEEAGDLLSEGLVEEAGWALVIHCNLHREDRQRLIHALPALVSNRFWFDHLGLDGSRITRWGDRNSEWAEAIRQSVSRPPQLAGLVRAQARRIADLTDI